MRTFDHLMQAVCECVGIDDMATVRSESPEGVSIAQFRVDDCDFSVSHAPIRPDRIFLQCDFGAVPERGAAAVLRKLLEINYLMYIGNSPSFSIHPGSGNVVFCSEENLDAIGPRALIESMELLAKHAQQWRQESCGAG
jgi:hypothetical protein